MPTSVAVGAVRIEQGERLRGPDGRAAIKWRLWIGPVVVLVELHEHELHQLHLALEAWTRANRREEA